MQESGSIMRRPNLWPVPTAMAKKETDEVHWEAVSFPLRGISPVAK